VAREGASTRGKQPRPTDKVPKPTLSERRKGGAVGSGEVGLEAATLERKRNSASAESPRPPSMDRGYEWYRILGRLRHPFPSTLGRRSVRGRGSGALGRPVKPARKSRWRYPKRECWHE